MEAYVSVHVSKFQARLDFCARSAFLVHILPISRAVLPAVLVTATGLHQVLDQISKWVRPTRGEISKHH